MIFLSKTQLKWLNEDKVFFSFRFYVLSIAYEWSYIDVWLDNMLFTKSLVFQSLTVWLGLQFNSNFVLDNCRE